MSYNLDQVDALRAAIAKGVTRVSMDGEEVQYASLADMRRQLQQMEAEIAGRPVTGPVLSYAHTSRGL
ncbi:phage head-tail joining protein [Pseudooceanicola marinus]|uniref:phage head-tail joining protein n=1 Tax=Pseudooceanicola marinus TaxID=396013 RepID=UPI001CD4D0CD|nr:hypothetical protein [Pseudooceanicola marinus]MCA1337363.1 hypothetical protein [Pseudooceanicola marinus]